MIIFTICTHGPYVVTKCYLPCADGTCIRTAYKWRVVWPLFCLCCCYYLVMSKI